MKNGGKEKKFKNPRIGNENTEIVNMGVPIGRSGKIYIISNSRVIANSGEMPNQKSRE